MLVACIRDDTYERRWKEYSTDTVGAFLTAFIKTHGNSEYTIPLFSELIYNRIQKEVTAQEVKDHILDLLKK